MEHQVARLRRRCCAAPWRREYYYVYAMDERGGEWKGKAFMCTRDREFKIEGRQDCYVRGYDRTGFFEVDTGKEAKNWTVQLTDRRAPEPRTLSLGAGRAIMSLGGERRQSWEERHCRPIVAAASRSSRPSAPPQPIARQSPGCSRPAPTFSAST